MEGPKSRLCRADGAASHARNFVGPEGSARMEDAKPIAALFALTAFAVAVLAGMSGAGDVPTTLTRALIVMPVCFAVGLVAGYAIRVVARDHVEEYTSGRPIPSVLDRAQVTASVVNSEKKS